MAKFRKGDSKTTPAVIKSQIRKKRIKREKWEKEYFKKHVAEIKALPIISKSESMFMEISREQWEQEALETM